MKQHPLCTDTEQVANVLDLAIPAQVKKEWAELQTRRHFLGREEPSCGARATCRAFARSRTVDDG